MTYVNWEPSNGTRDPERGQPMIGRSPERVIAWMSVTLLALALWALCSGPSAITFTDFFRAILGKVVGLENNLSAEQGVILWHIRGPRVIAAMLVGASLAGAGALYQHLFRNPLVSPDLLGVSSGAALGAALAIFLALPVLAIQGFAFSGGLLAVALVYAIGSAVRGHDAVLTLILTGVVVGTLMGAGVAMLKYVADPYGQLPAMTFWLLGSLAAITPSDLAMAAPVMILGFLPIYVLRWRVNVLSVPDDEARSQGINVPVLRAILIAAATLVTAAAVSISGVIGWIGLLVPHAARLLVGPGFPRLLPLSLVLGAAFMLGVDTLARAHPSVEIPPGVIAALIGAPLFLALLIQTRGRQT